MQDSSIIKRAVRVACGDARGDGELLIQRFSSRERTLRAIKLTCMAVMALLVAALIPAVHIVLVPLIALLSPVVIYRKWSEVSVIVGAEIVCAQCGGKLTNLNSRERYPLYETCLTCNRENRVLESDR